MSRFGFARRVQYLPDPGPGPGAYNVTAQSLLGDSKQALQAERDRILRRRNLDSVSAEVPLPRKPNRYEDLIETLEQTVGRGGSSNNNNGGSTGSPKPFSRASASPYLRRRGTMTAPLHSTKSGQGSGSGAGVGATAGSSSGSAVNGVPSSGSAPSTTGVTGGSVSSFSPSYHGSRTSATLVDETGKELQLTSRGPLRDSRLRYANVPTKSKHDVTDFVDPPGYRAAWLRLRPNEPPGPVLTRSRNSTASSQTFSSPAPAHTAEEAAKLRAEANRSRPSSTRSNPSMSPNGVGIPPGMSFTHGRRDAPLFISEDHSKHINQGIHGPGPKYKLPEVEVIARPRPPTAPVVPGSGRSHAPSFGSSSHAPSFGFHPHSRVVQQAVEGRKKLSDSNIGPGSYSVEARVPKWGDVSVTSGTPRVVIGGDSPRFFEPGTGPYISKRHEKSNVGGQSPGPKYYPKYYTLESELIRKKGPPPIPILPPPPDSPLPSRPASAPLTPRTPSTPAATTTPRTPSRPRTPDLARPSPRYGTGAGDFSPRTPKPLDRSTWLTSQNVRARLFGRGAAAWAVSPSDPNCASPENLRTVMRTDVKRGEAVESCSPGPGRYEVPSDFKPSERQKRQLLLGQRARQSLREQQLQNRQKLRMMDKQMSANQPHYQYQWQE